MLSQSIVKKLDSNNVVVDTDKMRERFDEVWKGSTNEKKNDAVNLGDYKDTRSFTNARNKGLLSTRMVTAIALTYQVNPFYITCDSEDKQLSEGKLNQFLEQNGFQEFTTDNALKKELLIYIEDLLEAMEYKDFQKLDQISEDDILVLLKSYLVKQGLNKPDSNKDLMLLKVLLTQ